MSEFNWNDRGIVVVPRQQSIAVYRTPEGGISIREEGYDFEEDSIIDCSTLEVAEVVAHAILREVKALRGASNHSAKNPDGDEN